MPLSIDERRQIEHEKGYADAIAGKPKRPPGASFGEKALLAAVVPVIGAIGFIKSDEDLARESYLKGYEKGLAVLKIMKR